MSQPTPPDCRARVDFGIAFGIVTPRLGYGGSAFPFLICEWCYMRGEYGRVDRRNAPFYDNTDERIEFTEAIKSFEGPTYHHLLVLRTGVPRRKEGCPRKLPIEAETLWRTMLNVCDRDGRKPETSSSTMRHKDLAYRCGKAGEGCRHERLRDIQQGYQMRRCCLTGASVSSSWVRRPSTLILDQSGISAYNSMVDPSSESVGYRSHWLDKVMKEAKTYA